MANSSYTFIKAKIDNYESPSEQKKRLLVDFTARFDLPRLSKPRLLEVIVKNQKLLFENEFNRFKVPRTGSKLD